MGGCLRAPRNAAGGQAGFSLARAQGKMSKSVAPWSPPRRREVQRLGKKQVKGKGPTGLRDF